MRYRRRLLRRRRIGNISAKTRHTDLIFRRRVSLFDPKLKLIDRRALRAIQLIAKHLSKIEMQQSAIVALTIGAFTLKIIAVSGLSLSLRKHCESQLEAWLGGWIAIQAATILFMLLASALDLLMPITMWIWLAIIALTLGRSFFKEINRLQKIKFNPWHAPAIVILITAGIRSLLFFDYTGDAYSYGYARIGIWMNYNTLLIHMPTPQINIFTNEWNGELLALMYGLASRDIQGLTFGNVETLGLMFLSTYWLATRLGREGTPSALIALAVTATPACLGLSATIKGDLLACVGVVLATGWILGQQTKLSQFSTFFGIAALGLAVGAKISASVTCFGLSIALIAFFLPSLRFRAPWVGLFGGIALACIFCARYFFNIREYGDPLNRAEGEGIKAGFGSLAGNIGILTERWFTFFPQHPPFEVWALSGGLGLTGAVVAAFFGVTLLTERIPRSSPCNYPLAALCVAASLLVASMTLIEPKDWNFRYFLPTICVLMVSVLCLPTSRRARNLLYALPFAAVANFLMTIRPGEVVPNFPNLNWASNWNAISSMTSIQRALLFHPGTYHVFRIKELGLDSNESGRSVAVFSELNSFLFELIGARSQNRLFLTETPSDLERALQQAPDLVILTKRNGRLPDSVETIVSRAGYHMELPTQAGDSTLWIARR